MRISSMRTEKTSPPIETLACPFPECEAHTHPNQGNLRYRNTYGPRNTRLLKCLTCGKEFSSCSQDSTL